MTVVAFDLDDTLFQEREFLYSAYRAIARIVTKEYPIDYDMAYNAMIDGGFDRLIAEIDHRRPESIAPMTIARCVSIYRTHIPDISLDNDTREVLDYLKMRDDTTVALITDGRTVTQSNKISALGLDRYICGEDTYISESVGHDKHTPYSFNQLMKRYPDARYIYVGDNPAKDFIIPRQLGWTTVGLRDKGINIHPQITTPGLPGQPDCWIDSLKQIIPLIYTDTSLMCPTI